MINKIKLKQFLTPIVESIIYENKTNDSSQKYALKYAMFDKQGRSVPKIKYFSSETQRKQFIKKIEEHDDFDKIIAYSDK